MQFLITAIVTVILLVDVSSSCPSACDCTDTLDGINVDCSSRGLDSIPTDLPNNTFDLQLQYNNISVVTENAFNNLPRLYRLSLYNNDISVIEDNAFNNLPNLKYHSLSSNKITSIKSDMFNNLQNLKALFLYSNVISVIEDNVFNNLPNLTALLLYDNKITSIKSDMFNNLTNLKTLYLYNNDISVIYDNAFNNLPSLLYIDLRNNPISFVSESSFVNLTKLTSLKFDMHCGGCENIPFWRWLKINQKFTSVTCNDYYGESLAKLEPNNFTHCFMDPCYSNPCLSNGQCTIGGIGSALCSCHGDWTGSQCELSPCSTVVCNDGECYYNESGIAKCFNKVSPCSTVVCNDGECYYNESGIAKCFNKAATKSDDNYTAVYTGVGASIATALVVVIIVLVTLRYRRTKKPQERRTTVANDCLNSGFDNIEPHYVSNIPMVEESHYDTIQNATALRHA